MQAGLAGLVSGFAASQQLERRLVRGGCEMKACGVDGQELYKP